MTLASSNNEIYIATTAPQSPPTTAISQLVTDLKSQQGLTLLGCLAAMAVLQLLGGGSKKGKIATSYWGGAKEKAAAARRAKKQMRKVTRNNVALYIGTPSAMKKRLQLQWQKEGLIKKPTSSPVASLMSSTPTLYVPDAQRGIAAIGAAGSGKTFSVIDPLVRSALDQGFPMCMYDFKYPAQPNERLLML
jgi:type IV secretory pathway TraG/TraD family ATPase VirD4